MAAPAPSRPARSLARRAARWMLWGGLGATLILQLRILADGGLRLPAFAHDYLERRAAAEGLSFSAEAIWLDPRGNILLVRPRLGLAGQHDPVASARAISLRLRRRALLAGEIRATRVEVTDLTLALPALFSPTGAPQPLLEAGEFRLSRDSDAGLWRVGQASARLLGVPAAFSGALPVASTPAAAHRPPDELLRSSLRQAAALYRNLASLPLDKLRVLRLDLAPEALALDAEIERLETPPHPALPPQLVGATLEDLSLRLVLPFSAPLRARSDDAELRLLAARFATSPSLGLRGEGLALRASPGPVLAVDLSFARIEKADTPLPPLPLVASARLAPAGRELELELAARLAGAPWRARLAGSLADRAGAVSASGELTPGVLGLVRPFLPEKARPILELTDPVALDLSAEFAPGARPARVVARASSGRAVAGRVPFDRAAAVLVYEPREHRLRADDLLLVQGDSRAEGSYAMDTESLAYRFLLSGSFRPASISNWFSGWWDRFWTDFGFGPVPPRADVDIQGVWRDPDQTTVFLQAASGPMRLRSLDLDSLQTRVQVAAGSFDILGFHAIRGPHVADGRFSRLLGPDHGAWAYMDFDVRADFPVEALPRLFPEEGPELIAPFALEAAPRIHLSGESFGPASATPGLQRYSLDLATQAPLRYSGFPLDHLSLRLEREGSDLRLRDIRAGFANGLATGEARLSGPDRERWLAFDLVLADAGLDLVQTRWKEFQAARPPATAAQATSQSMIDNTSASPASAPAGAPAKPSPSPKETKPLGGRLTARLAATGPIDDPLAFSGRGEARITGADLAQIRLMGPVSTLLGEIGMSFTTLKLSEADARLLLDRRRLVFEELRLTGPSALVESKGVYSLPGGTLDFKAKIRPFEQKDGLISSTVDFVTSPLSSVLEVELAGSLDAPTWTFTYGPTRLLRRLF